MQYEHNDRNRKNNKDIDSTRITLKLLHFALVYFEDLTGHTQKTLTNEP